MGWMELLLVGAVALIVVGPKDLPVMFQALGRITAKIKRMAREFQMAMSDAAKASGTSDITKDLKGLTSPKTLGLDRLKNAADSFDRWDPMASKGPESKADKKSGKGGLTEERAEQAKLIREKTAKTAQERLDREAADSAQGNGAVAEDSSPASRQPNDGEAPVAVAEKPAREISGTLAKQTGAKPGSANSDESRKDPDPRGRSASGDPDSLSKA